MGYLFNQSYLPIRVHQHIKKNFFFWDVPKRINYTCVYSVTLNCVTLRGIMRRQWQPTLVLLPEKSHGRRSLVGCSHGVAKSQARLRDFTFTFHFHALEKEMAIHSSVLAWRIPGTEEPSWLPSMGSHRVGHDWSDLAAAAARGITSVWRPRNP